MNNTRFATAIHILTLLAHDTDQWQSSEWIAGSIGINSVIVRKELIVLSEASLVITRKGKEGGAKLLKAACEVSMADVYLAVKNSEILGKMNQHPNPKCTVGKQINHRLDILFKEAEDILVKELKKKTLAEFAAQF